MRAIWACWDDGVPLRYDGEYYRHTLMTPMFTPEPQPYGTPRIFLAAVGEAMTELCGEVADGDKWARFEPFDGFKVGFTIDFNHPIFTRSTEAAVRRHREALGVAPVFKTVDTCAGELDRKSVV